MKVIPVLDLLDGQVVHGIQGRRESYQPIVSQIVKTSRPIDVVLAFGQKFGFTRFYLADLNAIQGNGDNNKVLRELRERFPNYSFVVDIGVKTLSDIERAGSNLVDIFILGTETLASLVELDRILEKLGHSRILVSLDLKNERLLHVPLGFQEHIRFFLQIFMKRRISEILVIDLARVGSQTGPIYPAIKQIRSEFQGHIILGGGVRNVSDLLTLQKAGFNGVLVATALHTGKLSPQEIASYL